MSQRRIRGALGLSLFSGRRSSAASLISARVKPPAPGPSSEWRQCSSSRRFAIGASIYANGDQLRSGIALGHYESTPQNRGLFDTPPPLIQLPAPLFIGSTSIRGASTHFGKVTRPDGVMLQLGQRSSDRDMWLLVPAGTSHNQASPWSSALALSHWRECNELHFISSLPPGGMQLLIGSADFIRHFPHMSAVGARQHPQQGPLLSGSGGGGGGSGGSGETGGGPTRPATGLLWPRGV